MYDTLIKHEQLAIEFVEALARLTEEDWRRPIAEGKWSIAEIIGHFDFWDTFLLTERLPHFFKQQHFQPAPTPETINVHTATFARNEPQQSIINRFTHNRQQLVDKMKALSKEQWEERLHIGDVSVTVFEYFVSQMTHDMQHFEQIEQAMKVN